MGLGRVDGETIRIEPDAIVVFPYLHHVSALL